MYCASSRDITEARINQSVNMILNSYKLQNCSLLKLKPLNP